MMPTLLIPSRGQFGVARNVTVSEPVLGARRVFGFLLMIAPA
jgi:hypothetical protein